MRSKYYLGLLLGVVPGLAKLLDVTLEELGAVGVFHELLALGDEVHHHLPLVLQLVEHLVLLLNVLLSLLAVGRRQFLYRPEIIN